MGGTPRPPPLLGTYTLLDLTPLGRQEDHEQHPDDPDSATRTNTPPTYLPAGTGLTLEPW